LHSWTLKNLESGKVCIVKNLRIFAPLINGEQFELADCLTGRDLVKGVFQNNWTAPPQALVIEASDKEGRVIRIVIPYDDSETARITVAEES
jgi:hypothetical protein